MPAAHRLLWLMLYVRAQDAKSRLAGCSQVVLMSSACLHSYMKTHQLSESSRSQATSRGGATGAKLPAYACIRLQPPSQGQGAFICSRCREARSGERSPCASSAVVSSDGLDQRLSGARFPPASSRHGQAPVHLLSDLFVVVSGGSASASASAPPCRPIGL